MAKQTSDSSSGAGVQSGLSSKEPLKNAEGQLSKPLSQETAKQGPHTPQSAGGPFKFK